MCFTIRKNKKNKKRKYKKKIHPEINHNEINHIEVKKTTTDKVFGKVTVNLSQEYISCFKCKSIFDLGSDKLKIHCTGCNEFFHCGIAGKCSGKDCCSETMRGEYHRLSWCVDCVPKMEGNEEKINGEGYCVCNDCLN